MERRRPFDTSLLAVLGVVALPLLCCGLPALAAAGALAGAGAWLGANGSWLAGGVVLAAAAGLGSRWWLGRRRCPRPASTAPDAVAQRPGPRP